MFRPEGYLLGQDARMLQPDGYLLGQDARMLRPGGYLLGQDARMLEPEGYLLGQDVRMLEPGGYLLGQDARMLRQEGYLLEQDARMLRQEGYLLEQDARMLRPRAYLEMQGPRKRETLRSIDSFQEENPSRCSHLVKQQTELVMASRVSADVDPERHRPENSTLHDPAVYIPYLVAISYKKNWIHRIDEHDPGSGVGVEVKVPVRWHGFNPHVERIHGYEREHAIAGKRIPPQHYMHTSERVSNGPAA